MSSEHERMVGRLTAPEIAERLSPTSILCLPFGTYEQHGPHLPIATDTILAEAVASSVVSRFGDSLDVWLLPALPFGYSPEHSEFDGGVGLSLSTCLVVLKGVCDSLAHAFPARGLLIVNGHGGNRGLLEAVIYELEKESGMKIAVSHPTSLSGVSSNSPRHEVHAGKSETSLMLAIASEDVHLDRCDPQSGTTDDQDEEVRTVILGRGVTTAWSSADPDLGNAGVIGAPQLAEASLGRTIFETAVANHERALIDLRARLQAR